MGNSSHDSIDYKEQIKDLFDESITEAVGNYEDLSISSCVYEPVLVGFKDTILEARLERQFYPQYDREILVRVADDKLLTIPLEDLRYLAFANRPQQIEKLPVSSYSDVIELYKGGSYELNIPQGQDFDIGLYGVRTDPDDRYRYFFLSNNNIRARCQNRPLGEIIVDMHILTEDTMQSALKRQHQLRNLRLGTIIAKKINLPHQEVEKIIRQAQQQSGGHTSHHTGDILVQAGLATPEMVRQSISFQRQIRHIRIGKLLVEMGYVDENQIYKVLAEKFRKRYMNLHDVRPSAEVVRQLSKDIIKKLSVVPVYFRNNRLVIATPFPERAEIGDILRQRLTCPFELVVAPPHQIVDAQANLFTG